MITLSKAQLEASISQAQVIREEAEVEEIHAKNLSELRYCTKFNFARHIKVLTFSHNIVDCMNTNSRGFRSLRN